MSEPLDQGPFFHGTKAALQPGDLLTAGYASNYRPEVIDLGQQYYDSTLAASGFADGVYVQTNTQPFENPSPAITDYVKILHDFDAKVATTSLGVQAFSAALLFATVAKKLGSNLTRDALLADAKAQTDWTGGGLHPPQNLDGKTTNTCTIILKVVEGKFVKVYPDNDSNDPTKSFACDPEGITDVHGDWGAPPTTVK